MHDQIERRILKRKGFGHIRADDVDLIPFALGYHALALKLPLGIVQHRTARTRGCKQWHLLPAAAGKTQQVNAL
ncbi:hypothetical protein SDC9_205652 [bioreactor metagenome]|uniref:Uncharacterized protein n=1 Tax=bioreactor metagenome TaxID=1076179 RepID=A0A645J3E2_9ZZZZ